MTTQQTLKATLVVLTTLIAGYLLISNVRILIVLLIAIIIASALRPLTIALERIGIPSGLAITLAYLLLGFFIVSVFILVLPPVITQFANYLENDSRLANRIIIARNWIEQQISTVSGQPVVISDEADIRQAISTIMAQVRVTAPTALVAVGNTVGEALLVFVMGVYWLTSRDKAINFLASLFPPVERLRVQEVISEVETTLGGYVRGVLLVAVFVTVANFTLMSLFRVSNAATLAVIIGITTMLPIVGGFIGAGTATLLAALASPIQGLIVFASFVAVQQLEMHVVTPRVMARSVGIDPLLVILAIFVGFAMYGPTGAIIAVPIAGALAVLFSRYFVEPRKAELEYEVVDGGVLLGTPPAADLSQPAGPVQGHT